MSSMKKSAKQTAYYENGNVKARGSMKDGELHGFWEWFRKDGSKMRSGHFSVGKQVGEWITYDHNSKIYKKKMMTE